MKFRKIALVSALSLTMALAACSGDGSATDSTSNGGQSGEITVFAAASLNAAFPEIAESVFAEEYPDVAVNFSFEGSSALVEKMTSGAQADVFASANEANMDKAVEADLVNDPVELTKNTLRLIVPAGNPAGITDLESANAANFVLCAPQVPCGAVSAELAKVKGMEFTPVSEEQSVTDVRTKVETGEADAGLVYLTDAMLAGDGVDIVDVPGMTDVGTVYMIATLKEAPEADLGQAFVDAVMSDAGQEIMATYGFGDN
ncbi:molybdate transport system substrate-binding protein [Trueperella bonasi]|uniref:Molybdate transport system substrate-binding protein n=1 Tax=Trueperella bonasi TaxID=312286 RepID=A0ABT9NFT1_9ACTO|nr:molybdate ABC transporter substrate-binding protein [Trueperella bonasi]MDP9806252.1 molybdate transport system substrate-binding protein [Trueperella bonasi]